MERIIEMLNILGPNIFLNFHYYVLTGPQTDILRKMCQICVLNKGEQSNCVMLPLGNQDLASSKPWSDYFTPRGHLNPCEIILAIGLDLLISFLYECLILVGSL